ncbi:MAG: hypothetical protein AAFW89_15220, partial [Bacteroidota bacterium]
GCSVTQQQVEKEIERCIITMSEDQFDSEEKIDVSNLAVGIEKLLLDKKLLNDRDPAAYQNLFNLLNEEKIDSTELEKVMQDFYQKNFDIIHNAALYAIEYACVVDTKEKFPELFETTESLQTLYQSFEELKKTNDLGVFVTSITDAIPNAEFQEKIVYRVPVITAMYSIMEQTYSRNRNQ